MITLVPQRLDSITISSRPAHLQKRSSDKFITDSQRTGGVPGISRCSRTSADEMTCVGFVRCRGVGELELGVPPSGCWRSWCRGASSARTQCLLRGDIDVSELEEALMSIVG